MSIKISQRANIENFRALSILSDVEKRRAAGQNIINLGVGQPCFGAPKATIEKTRQYLTDTPAQGYTPAIGQYSLRKRIAQHYQDKYNCAVDVERIAVTTASSGGFIMSLMSAFEAGDTVALTTPTYPAYRNMLQSLNINVIEIETTKEQNYQPTAALLEECGEKFDGLIITNPSNPSGALIDDETLKGICEWCDKNEIRLISDEAYHGITFETPAQTALKFSDNVIVLNTFSKYFALTGWRLGWVITPPDMAKTIKSLSENLFVAPPTISQFVAKDIFNHTDILDHYVDQYRANRDLLRARLPALGFKDMSSAQGAFYLYVDIQNLTNDSEEFCRRMLDEASVAMTPGLDFDPARGHTTIRISYAGSLEDMNEACDRLEKWLG